MARYRIKNWAKYQHYKDRNPPWIKLHVQILASEDWVMLDDASKLVMVVCMIIAAKNCGEINDDPAYFRRAAYLSKTPNLKPLIECGFLVPLAIASNSEQEQAEFRPEKEGETETEGEKKEYSARKRALISDEVPEGFEEFWSAYPLRKDRQDAIKAFRAAIKAGASVGLLVSGAGAYAREVAGKEPEFIKRAGGWLRGRRWENYSATATVIRPSAFNSPEEQELQRQMKERIYGKA